MRDLQLNEFAHVYGATGSSRSCYTPPKCAKKSKSKSKNSCKPAKKSKSKKGWC